MFLKGKQEKRDRFQARIDKQYAIKQAESQGIVADSIEVRKALLEKVHAGEITLEEAQEQLKKIKRSAKKNGQVTRKQVWSRG